LHRANLCRAGRSSIEWLIEAVLTGFRSTDFQSVRARLDLWTDGLQIRPTVSVDPGSIDHKSLRVRGVLTEHRRLTIEVVPLSRRIVTALGPCNRLPKDEERFVLEQWAREARLTLGV